MLWVTMDTLKRTGIAVLVVALSAVGCGGSVETTTAENGAPSPGADGGTGGTSLPGSDAGQDGLGSLLGLLDALPIPDSGPAAECVTCLRDQCAQPLLTCLSDPACQQGITCVVTTCASALTGGAAGAGGTDLLCMLACFGGDLGAAAKAGGALTCVTGTCTSTCSSLLAPGDAGRDARAAADAAPTPPDAPAPADAAPSDDVAESTDASDLDASPD
jgi:hypothetical protein